MTAVPRCVVNVLSFPILVFLILHICFIDSLKSTSSLKYIALGCNSLQITNDRSVTRNTPACRKLDHSSLVLHSTVSHSWLELQIDNLYSRSVSLKCPFFRRRGIDLADSLTNSFNFLLARHKSLSIPNSLSTTQPYDISLKKVGLSLPELKAIVESDWNSRMRQEDGTLLYKNSGKGYYITGKLTQEIYRDDCYFTGPDPDMPVKGLRKYVLSVSHLFDHKVSKAHMITISSNSLEKSIKVTWRLEGKLNLPWKPSIKPWTGSTKYFIDEDGLVMAHAESWDIDVVDAFVSTLFPFLNYGAPPAPPVFDELEKEVCDFL